MPRALSIGNGKLHVNFDIDYQLRDLFYPHVGQENHFAGEKCRTGFWSNGRFAWERDAVWEKSLEYEKDTLVTAVRLYHPIWKLELLFNDTVDLNRCILVRRIQARNHSEYSQEVRVFFHYDFHIYGVGVGDTVLYDPVSQAIIAYKGKRYFLANVSNRSGPGILNWAIGVTELHGREGTWRDAEDGRLEENPIAQGSVDGTLALDLGTIEQGESVEGHHWLAVAESKDGVMALDTRVRERSPDSFLDRTRDWWRAWLANRQRDFADLTDESASLYKRSLLTIRTHVDDDGAIIGSTDWDIISFSRDTYAYCWPRDGALVAMAMDEAGYGALTRQFFKFCLRVLNPMDGYFLHKYTPAGGLASSWHPWIGADKKLQLPIQEDETGLILMALWKHYQTYRDIEFIKPFYRPLIRATADFIVEHRNKDTGLPLASYDLWEERWGIHAYTIASVWAGLQAAANFASAFNQHGFAEIYSLAANEIKTAASLHLWDDSRNHFARSLYPAGQSSYDRDSTLDASTLALSLYGMVDPQDDMMRATARAIHERLWCQTEVGGLARYENDPYHRVSHDGPKLPGNPWFISTLWLAQYYIAAAESRSDLGRARDLLRWVEQFALGSELLAEQVNPYGGEPLSVSPLTWSHAEYVATIHRYLESHARFA